jgi:hypothetical protein
VWYIYLVYMSVVCLFTEFMCGCGVCSLFLLQCVFGDCHLIGIRSPFEATDWEAGETQEWDLVTCGPVL